MNTPQYYRDLVERQLADMEYPAGFPGLFEPITYAMSSGGKRLRPMLALACAEAFGVDAERALWQALGLEMFHNYTLLHDDVMDRADMRRGRPTVRARYGTNAAILSGDAMLTMATGWFVRNLDSRDVAPALELFNTTAMEIYEGQDLDVSFESRTDVSVEEYIEMIRLKTSVLLGCACRIGAIRGGADAMQQHAMQEYGVNLGLAFQLQDDLLDTFGDPATFGKAIGGDILNDKKTYLLITALNRADASQRNTMLGLQGKRNADKVEIVRNIYVATGAESSCRELIERYTSDAVNALGRARLPESAVNFFTEIALKSASRDK